MKLIITFFCVFLIYGCSVKNIDPELVDEYFFKKEVSSPTVQPTTKELEGIYMVERIGDWEGRVLAQKEFELIAVDESNMYFKIYRRCLLSCEASDIDPNWLTRYPNMAIEDKIYLKLEGFSIYPPFQQIKYGNATNEYVNISGGKGKLTKNKKSFSFNYELFLGVEPVGSIPYTYNFIKK